MQRGSQTHGMSRLSATGGAATAHAGAPSKQQHVVNMPPSVPGQPQQLLACASLVASSPYFLTALSLDTGDAPVMCIQSPLSLRWATFFHAHARHVSRVSMRTGASPRLHSLPFQCGGLAAGIAGAGQVS